mmetsp:Transcript_32248/g.63006  ORF Transcript_32248/g.63006 Transcript_32248/m.63006 type:complete len:241 (-) Transcript_32248:125-847(-)
MGAALPAPAPKPETKTDQGDSEVKPDEASGMQRDVEVVSEEKLIQADTSLKLPSFYGEKTLQRWSAWIEEDPFVKHRDELPPAKSVALFTTGLAFVGTVLMYRWNKRAGRLVDMYLKEVEAAKRKGLPPPQPKEASTGEAAWLGMKALGVGTILSTTYFVAAGAWTVHFMGVQSAREFAQAMQSVLRGPRRALEGRYKEEGEEDEDENKLSEKEMQEAFATLFTKDEHQQSSEDDRNQGR